MHAHACILVAVLLGCKLLVLFQRSTQNYGTWPYRVDWQLANFHVFYPVSSVYKWIKPCIYMGIFSPYFD